MEKTMFEDYKNDEYVMSKKYLNGLKNQANNAVNRALNYDFKALCQEIKSVYANNNTSVNIYYKKTEGLLKGSLDREYYEDYIPYSSKKYVDVFPAYTYTEDHKGIVTDKPVSYKDEITDWKSLNIDMSKYLAFKGKTLFDIIDKISNPKITAKNCNMTKEDVIYLQYILKKALDYQLKFIRQRYSERKVSNQNYLKYMHLYDHYEKTAAMLSLIWESSKIQLAKQKFNTKRNHFKKIKNRLIKSFTSRFYADKREARNRRIMKQKIDAEIKDQANSLHNKERAQKIINEYENTKKKDDINASKNADKEL